MNLDGSGNPVPNASQGDLFSYRLDYETAYIYDGNIGKQSWQASTNNVPTGLRAYTFTYDNISRLKSATYTGVGSENYSLPTINYDRNGNITSMQRNGKLASTYGLMDNLTYTYSGNRLTKVEDAVAGNYDVDFVNRNSGTDDYSYYANGALKADKNEDITDIIYSTYANQPIEIQLSGSRWIKNFYDGAGRLYKTSYSTGEYWEYLDGMVFKNGAFYQLTTPEGRANYESGAWTYEYFITDHLGNTRVAYKANGTALTKTSETAFDPWGVVLNGINQVNSFQNRFEFLNREKESTFNLNLIRLGARGYNPTIGRFDRVDPVVAEQEEYSAYQYGWNNPVLRSDPNGDCPVCFVIFAGLFLASQPALAPSGGKNAKQEMAAYKQTYNDMGSDVVSSVMPVGKSATVSQALYSTAKKEVKEEIKKQGQKLAENAKQGKDFEKTVIDNLKESGHKNISEQVTIKAENGVKTRVDVVSKDKSGEVKLTEAKSSQTAPLTKNQKSAFPSIEQKGGTVVGKGKPGFEGGTEIPPTKVDIVRPKN